MEPTAFDGRSQLPVGLAKLLQGVEKSYDPGKKLLEESGKSNSFASRYETAEGKTINYTSERGGAYQQTIPGLDAGGEAYQQTIPSLDMGRGAEGSAVADVQAGRSDLQRHANPLRTQYSNRLRKEQGEFAHVERVFRESHSFDFMAGHEVKDASDVAFIFSQLEDASAEHSFAVFVKDGDATVVELGMGDYNQTMINVPAIIEADRRLKPDVVYFVHNHPSGNLSYSQPDVQLLSNIEEALGKEVFGIIVNLRTGKYGTFNAQGNYSVEEKREGKALRPLKLYAFDRQVFADDYNPENQPLVRSSRDVAAFIQSHRLGGRNKVSLLILSQSNRIIGNIHTNYTSLQSSGLAEKIVNSINVFGGMSGIVYGSGVTSTGFGGLKAEVKRRSGKFTLLDAVKIEGEHTKEYRSANDGDIFEPGAEYKPAESNGDKTKFRVIDEGEDELLSFLNSQPLKKGYRYAQWADMGVRPPMAAKVGGEWRPPMIFSRWEQSEEGMRKANGKADLVQGNGRTTGNVAYNPYFHIRTSPLNDQFTAAYDRPELIVVEGYYPESEETSGYRAEGAKDSVGLMDWHSGSVNGQLSDGTKVQTMLSRYFKPSRIVPWGEVADLIMERVGDQKITFPINAVPPMLRAELAKRGARFGDVSGQVAEGDVAMLQDLRDRVNGGEHDAGLEKAEAYLDAYDSSEEAMVARAEELSQKLHTPIRLITDGSDLLDTSDPLINRKRRAKGWATDKGEIVVVVPNNVNVADIENTVVHEVVGHDGLEALIGKERMDEFSDEIYSHVTGSIRSKIDARAEREMQNDIDRMTRAKGGGVFAKAEATAEAGYKKRSGHYQREATKEYMADMAGEIGDKGFERMSQEELTLWGRIKARVQQFLDAFLSGLKTPKRITLTDKDLAYILYKSWKHKRGDVFNKAEDAVMRRKTGYDESPLAEVTEKESQAIREKAVSDRVESLFDEAVAGNLTGRPVEIGKLTPAGKEYLEKLSGKAMKDVVSFVVNPSDMVHIYRRHFGDNEKDGRNVPLSKADIREMHAIVCNPDRVIYGEENTGQKRGMFFFLQEAGGGSYNLMEVYSDRRGNLTSKSFFKSREGVSQRVMLLNESSTLTSVTDGATLSDGAKLPKFFEYPKSEDEPRYHFRDGGLGLEETITQMKVAAAQVNSDNLQAKRDATRAIGGNLTKLRQAMARQKDYDITTVKSVTDLAKVLLEK